MHLIGKTAGVAAAGLLLLAGSAQADILTAAMKDTSPDGSGIERGIVRFTDTPAGLEIETRLFGLPAGAHGFHVHEHGDCAAEAKDGNVIPAQAAGGHYDPDKTGKHLGPEGGGHRGDLPVLQVDANGLANVTMRLPGVKADEFKGRALIIHAGGDNYSDSPEPLGGGGDRIACGILE